MNKKKEDKTTEIQEVVNHYFYSKGLSIDEIKENAKKRKIIYSRFTRPAKQLLELAGSIKEAQFAIDRISKWAKSRNLDYTIETVLKKWLELDKLKPKEIVKKPFYRGNPLVWSQAKKNGLLLMKPILGLNLLTMKIRLNGVLLNNYKENEDYFFRNS